MKACTKCLRKGEIKTFICKHTGQQRREHHCPSHGRNTTFVVVTLEQLESLRGLVSNAWARGVWSTDPGDGTSPSECELNEEICGEEGCETTEQYISRHNPFKEDWADG